MRDIEWGYECLCCYLLLVSLLVQCSLSQGKTAGKNNISNERWLRVCSRACEPFFGSVFMFLLMLTLMLILAIELAVNKGISFLRGTCG